MRRTSFPTPRHAQHVVALSLIMMLNSTPFAHASSSKYQPNNIANSENKDICIDNDPEEASSPKKSSESPSPLALARNLHAPLATDTQEAEFEHASFWEDHGSLLQDAWKEWEDNTGGGEHDGFINPTLSTALDDAFGNPSRETESAVKSIWTNPNEEEQTLPNGVYAMQLLTPSGITHIRNLLDIATSSGIPTRRPNGMNRHGVIVDSNVHGAVSMKSLVKLVEEEVIDRVVRPVGRMLFPDRVGCSDDVEYFAFTIRYDGSDDDAHDNKSIDDDDEESVQDDDASTPKRDFELKEHRDASIVTLNINLNLPEEGYAGSEVYFRDFPSEDGSTMTAGTTNDEQDPTSPDEGNSSKDDGGGTVRFNPGMAILHLGAHRHGSLPISASTSKSAGSGKRYNLVIWLFGKDGDVRIAPYAKEERMNVLDRWYGCDHTQGLGFD